MKRLEVFYNGWGERLHVGTLAHHGEDLLFEYSADALKRGLEFSPLKSKLQKTAYARLPSHQFGLPGFIADSLPDGWGLLVMDRFFKAQGRNIRDISPLDRLAFVNGKAMGALSFEPANRPELDQQDVDLLDLAQQSHLLLQDKESEALKKLALMGGSPQGARPKVLAYLNEKTKELSTQPNNGSAWLIKFQAQGEHKEACAIEHIYAQLARECGIEMPRTRYVELDKKLGAFGIERFDVAGDTRIPVHTLAGVLHADFRTPTVDYITFLRVTQMLCRDIREVLKAYTRTVFNVVFNNRDDHAKNFSYLMDKDGKWKLSPGYDITFNEGPGHRHQMDVCGQDDAISRKALLELARKSDLDIAEASHVIDKVITVARSFKPLTGPLAKETGVRPATLKHIESAIMRNLKALNP